MKNKYPPAIPGVDQFPFPELNRRIHTDVQIAFDSSLMKKKNHYTGHIPLQGQVVLDGF